MLSDVELADVELIEEEVDDVDELVELVEYDVDEVDIDREVELRLELVEEVDELVEEMLDEVLLIDVLEVEVVVAIPQTVPFLGSDD